MRWKLFIVFCGKYIRNTMYHDYMTAPLAAHASASDLQDHRPGLPVWLARHRRIWQTTISLLPTSARANSDRPTQRCASFDVQITISAPGVLRLLDHACWTRCQSIYGSATVSDSLNGCWRPISSVFGTVTPLLGAPFRNYLTYLPNFIRIVHV